MAEATTPSSSFHALDPRIQRWIWEKNWNELKDIQELAIPLVLSEDRDLIISAATASGKTEAAFLPICSRLVQADSSPGSALYISPLKALINDQFGRLFEVCEKLELPVYPWHGDVSGSRKTKFFETRSGIVLITPESLESLFVNHGYRLKSYFERLSYIVVDELHSFMGSERGRQLQSLLDRLELRLDRRVPRIGLSATLGEMELAAEFLRPGSPEKVELIVSADCGQELQLVICGHRQPAHTVEGSDADAAADANEKARGANPSIVAALYTALRGTNNLVFANSRSNVERYSDRLRARCEANRVPNEFFPHHGSLSKEIREFAESEIKDKSTPTTIVCTSTLEMGIDIGAIDSVAQVGVPSSVASLRQRLGRSGRRGNPAVLRMFVEHTELTPQTHLVERLRPDLFQSVAMIELLLAKWYEPPAGEQFHFSVLIQQVLSAIAERGGATAKQLWQMFCERGPFKNISQSDFLELLRAMGAKELLIQSADGLLLHGQIGERIVNNYEFYAVFKSPEEYRLIADGRTLGSLPVNFPLYEQVLLVFGGRRWLVTAVDEAAKTIYLTPASGGVPPSFGGERGEVHDRIRQEMLRLYQSEEIPIYLNPIAKEFMAEGRAAFSDYHLSELPVVFEGKSAFFFPWVGDRILHTLKLLFDLQELRSEDWGMGLEFKADMSEFRSATESILANGGLTAVELAARVSNNYIAKYDGYLNADLLHKNYASARIDLAGALGVLRRAQSLGV